jgi:hypothetical protein
VDGTGESHGRGLPNSATGGAIRRESRPLSR